MVDWVTSLSVRLSLTPSLTSLVIFIDVRGEGLKKGTLKHVISALSTQNRQVYDKAMKWELVILGNETLN